MNEVSWKKWNRKVRHKTADFDTLSRSDSSFMPHLLNDFHNELAFTNQIHQNRVQMVFQRYQPNLFHQQLIHSLWPKLFERQLLDPLEDG
jgi:hypothetical protein